jgi:antagonist of KipI
MSLSIIKPGILDTIQDSGRNGYGKWGINPGGAMDSFASEISNMLVGNAVGEAVLEIHFPGPQILFEQNALIAITGADFSPTLNDQAIPLWQPVVIRKNTVLHFPRLINGARCYLSVHGGFLLDKWLNSYSTNLKAGAGGFQGQALKQGDELNLRESSIYFAAFLKEDQYLRVLPWKADISETYRHLHEIYIIKGHEWNQLVETSQSHFFDSIFIIHPSSDRMGYHLKGIDLELRQRMELLSSAVSFGTVQLLPTGQLIVLMADHQTTGGYPRIGHVISAHLAKLAQLRPCDAVQFKLVDAAVAEDLLLSRNRQMAILQRACLDHLNQRVC